MMLTEFFATCTTGLEFITAQELTTLGAEVIGTSQSRVFFRAEWNILYRLHLYARTVHRVFVLLARAQVRNLKEIEEVAWQVPYEEWFENRYAFAIRSERDGTHDFTSMDIARVVGQVVCDRFIARRGQRPPVNLDNPDVEIFSTLVDDQYLLGLNLTGSSLHRRPWRQSLAHLTALRPTLAAAVVMASGWDHRPLVDPMCGTGTLLIEGALWRRGISPLLGREEWAFRVLIPHDERRWQAEQEASRTVNGVSPPIRGSDWNARYIEIARQNAQAAQVGDIVFSVANALTLPPPEQPVVLVTNPPYGVRMGKPSELVHLYRKLWHKWSVEYGGSRIVAISGNPAFEQSAPREPSACYDFLQAALPCRLLIWDLP
jgi:23S rRNA G2445 N2-methylase RlmL